jgi:hypothetical protein
MYVVLMRKPEGKIPTGKLTLRLDLIIKNGLQGMVRIDLPHDTDPRWALAKTVMKFGVEICGLLGNYTASCGYYLPTFRDNVSVPSSRVKIPRGKKALSKETGQHSGAGNRNIARFPTPLCCPCYDP